jgi:Tol biopolymer transport system component
VLSAGNFRIGIFDLASGETRVLDHMDAGKNINPAWGPEGKYLAFVSDRGGVSDLYLYDFAQDDIFQITHLLTGSAGFTPLSPVLSWAPDADKIAFMYYEKGGFNVYLLSNPRSLARTPWRAPAPRTPPGARSKW